MNYLDIGSLFLMMITLAAIPSASVALVVTRSISLGVSNGVAVALGIVLGDLVFIFLAILGLSVIAETMGALFVIIKYVSAAYLLWLGYSLLKSKNKPTYSVNESELRGNIVISFLSGIFLTLGDVKAVFFYVSLFPAFIDLTAIKNIDLLIIILITIAAVGGVKITYAIIAKKVMNTSQGMRYQKGVNKLAGGFMIGAGSYMIVKA